MTEILLSDCFISSAILPVLSVLPSLIIIISPLTFASSNAKSAELTAALMLSSSLSAGTTIDILGECVNTTTFPFLLLVNIQFNQSSNQYFVSAQFLKKSFNF